MVRFVVPDLQLSEFASVIRFIRVAWIMCRRSRRNNAFSLQQNPLFLSVMHRQIIRIFHYISGGFCFVETNLFHYDPHLLSER
jgi:hypothetical protein